MKNKKKIYCFDLDNVICTTKGNNYKKSTPKKKVVNFINKLYEKNYYIKIFTARYMGRNNENISKAKRQGYLSTKKQLKLWKLKYHDLIFGKPSYDIFIDDKCYGFNKNWINKIQKNLKI